MMELRCNGVRDGTTANDNDSHEQLITDGSPNTLAGHIQRPVSQCLSVVCLWQNLAPRTFAVSADHIRDR